MPTESVFNYFKILVSIPQKITDNELTTQINNSLASETKKGDQLVNTSNYKGVSSFTTHLNNAD
jgi:hypothetical protein